MSATDENNVKATGSDTNPTPGAKEAAVRQARAGGHKRPLSYLAGRLGSADEAVDVMHRFGLRAINRAGTLRDTLAVRGWPGRVLATSIADNQRRSARRRQPETPMSHEMLEAIIPEPEADMDAAVCACLHLLLPTPKPDYADSIDRVDLHEQSREVVAVSLGISAANLTVRLHRARQALKQRLVDLCLT